MSHGIETSPHQIDNDSYEFSQRVADLLDFSISPERIQNLIDVSNTEGFIFHGIKNNEAVPYIEEHGILPLTPEGGDISCWTMGKRLFGTSNQKKLFGYDSTFFHYAPSQSKKNPNIYSMNIAVTKAGISVPELKVYQNQELHISKPVPRQDIALLRTEIMLSGENNRAQTVRKIETNMFKLLEFTVNNFEPGGSYQIPNFRISQ